MASATYGQAFGRRFGATRIDALVSMVLQKTEVAVTFLRQQTPTYELSEPMPREDATLLSMGFQDFLDYRLWEDGKPVPAQPVIAPQITMYDLRTAPYILVNNPMIGIHFHLPRAAFDALADNSGTRRIDGLNYPRGAGVDDPTVYHLVQALLPAFERPAEANRLFVDHVTLAVLAHVAQVYGGMPAAWPRRGGLAAWQERLAKEVLEANLEGDISLALVAKECRLSPGHFARAFRQSTGVPPHRWLLQRRVEKAKRMLRETAMPLSEIADFCGFADQSHFTRVFTKLAGAPPRMWRSNEKSRLH